MSVYYLCVALKVLTVGHFPPCICVTLLQNVVILICLKINIYTNNNLTIPLLKKLNIDQRYDRKTRNF